MPCSPRRRVTLTTSNAFTPRPACGGALVSTRCSKSATLATDCMFARKERRRPAARHNGNESALCAGTAAGRCVSPVAPQLLRARQVGVLDHFGPAHGFPIRHRSHHCASAALPTQQNAATCYSRPHAGCVRSKWAPTITASRHRAPCDWTQTPLVCSTSGGKRQCGERGPRRAWPLVPRRSRIVAEWAARHQKCAGHQALRARDCVFA